MRNIPCESTNRVFLLCLCGYVQEYTSCLFQLSKLNRLTLGVEHCIESALFVSSWILLFHRLGDGNSILEHCTEREIQISGLVVYIFTGNVHVTMETSCMTTYYSERNGRSAGT